MADDGGLKVTVELGLVLPVTQDGFGNVKPRIVLADIDPYGDVDHQIQVGLETAVKAFAEIDGQMDRIISDLLAPVTGKPGFRDRLEVLEKDVQVAKGNIRRMADKVKSMDKDLAERVKTRGRGEGGGG